MNFSLDQACTDRWNCIPNPGDLVLSANKWLFSMLAIIKKSGELEKSIIKTQTFTSRAAVAVIHSLHCKFR
jgi:hypothetical protein